MLLNTCKCGRIFTGNNDNRQRKKSEFNRGLLYSVHPSRRSMFRCEFGNKHFLSNTFFQLLGEQDLHMLTSNLRALFGGRLTVDVSHRRHESQARPPYATVWACAHYRIFKECLTTTAVLNRISCVKEGK